MRTIIKYVTFDGAEHNSQKDATRHLERLYSDAITKLAHNVVCVEKYAKMAEFIDSNLHSFLELQRIKDEMALAAVEEDDF